MSIKAVNLTRMGRAYSFCHEINSVCARPIRAG